MLGVHHFPVTTIGFVRINRTGVVCWHGWQHAITPHLADVFRTRSEFGHIEPFDFVEPVAGGLDVCEDRLVVRVVGGGENDRVLYRCRRSREIFGDNRGRAESRSAARMSRLLGVNSQARALRALAPLLSLIPDLGSWNPWDRATLGRAIQAKDGRSEAQAARLLAEHPRLDDALRQVAAAARLESEPPEAS